jgi:hypothetical protein
MAINYYWGPEDSVSVEPSSNQQRLWPMQVIQNCYVVKDLDEACRRLHRLYGIGPFLGGGAGELGRHVYRGKPAPPIEIRGVFVQRLPRHVCRRRRRLPSRRDVLR